MPYVRTTTRGGRKLVYQPLSPPIWTQPGGIVWVGIAIWILIHLGAYAMTVGFVPAQHRGIAYELPAHRLRSIDIQRILGGIAVRDGRGNVVVEPDSEHIQIVVVDTVAPVMAMLSPR